jgi:hypothetical protein
MHLPITNANYASRKFASAVLQGAPASSVHESARGGAEVPQTRLILRITGCFCLLGACVTVLGTFQTWYRVTDVVREQVAPTRSVDLYQLSAHGVASPIPTWCPVVIAVGAVGLAIVGLVAVTLSQGIPLLWMSLSIAVASALTTFGALAARTGSVISVSVYVGVTRGLGEAITLVGAGLGIFAVLGLLYALRSCRAARALSL